MGPRRSQPKRKSISTRLQLQKSTVKSAGRVLAILEYFDDLQRPSTVTEIAEELGYPQSSTSALMHSLVSVGYLNYDRRARTYVPSTRVALLGSWLNPRFVTEGPTIAMMRKLNELTGDAIVLAVRNGLHMQYIHVIQATNPARLHLTLGTVRPLVGSGTGYAALSTLPDSEVTRLVMRSNDGGLSQVDVRDFLKKIAVVRQKGYAFVYDNITRGGGIIAALLPEVGDQDPIVVGIGGVSEVMRAREHELASILKQELVRHAGADSARSGYGKWRSGD
jgi:DNA-binding IclR family transcriptional regulator